MELLARAVKLAAKIKEESYDLKKAEKLDLEDTTKIANFEDCYTISLEEASDQAAEKVGFDKRGVLPVYLLLKYAWNDILDWADQFNE